MPPSWPAAPTRGAAARPARPRYKPRAPAVAAPPDRAPRLLTLARQGQGGDSQHTWSLGEWQREEEEEEEEEAEEIEVASKVVAASLVGAEMSTGARPGRRFTVGRSEDATHPDTIRAAISEFIATAIFVFAAEGSVLSLGTYIYYAVLAHNHGPWPLGKPGVTVRLRCMQGRCTTT